MGMVCRFVTHPAVVAACYDYMASTLRRAASIGRSPSDGHLRRRNNHCNALRMHCERERAHCESALQRHRTTWCIAKRWPAFPCAVRELGAGDVLNVNRLDRLARSLREGNQSSPRHQQQERQQEQATGAKGATAAAAVSNVRTSRHAAHHACALAEFERDLIRTRTAEGRSRAQKRGQHMGRSPKHRRAEGRGPAATGAGRYTRRTRPQRQRRHIHHSPSDARRMSSALCDFDDRAQTRNKHNISRGHHHLAGLLAPATKSLSVFLYDVRLNGFQPHHQQHFPQVTEYVLS
jgi:hypothetical protein